jgi:hypothetical protein
MHACIRPSPVEALLRMCLDSLYLFLFLVYVIARFVGGVLGSLSQGLKPA